MYEKYNIVLRSRSKVPALVRKYEELCCANDCSRQRFEPEVPPLRSSTENQADLEARCLTLS